MALLTLIRLIYEKIKCVNQIGTWNCSILGSIHDKPKLVIAGLHLTGLQGLCLPSFKTKERARSQQQRHQWFNEWGSLHIWSKVLEQHPTLCSGRQTGHGSSLCSWGEGEITSYTRIDIRLAH